MIPFFHLLYSDVLVSVYFDSVSIFYLHFHLYFLLPSKEYIKNLTNRHQFDDCTPVRGFGGEAAVTVECCNQCVAAMVTCHRGLFSLKSGLIRRATASFCFCHHSPASPSHAPPLFSVHWLVFSTGSSCTGSISINPAIFTFGASEQLGEQSSSSGRSHAFLYLPIFVPLFF